MRSGAGRRRLARNPRTQGAQERGERRIAVIFSFDDGKNLATAHMSVSQIGTSPQIAHRRPSLQLSIYVDTSRSTMQRRRQHLTRLGRAGKKKATLMERATKPFKPAHSKEEVQSPI
jgi:Mg-chelatase subunit ChlD